MHYELAERLQHLQHLGLAQLQLHFGFGSAFVGLLIVVEGFDELVKRYLLLLRRCHYQSIVENVEVGGVEVNNAGHVLLVSQRRTQTRPIDDRGISAAAAGAAILRADAPSFTPRWYSWETCCRTRARSW